MAQADTFVVVSNVQFERTEGWQRRHKIKSHHGDMWLTVPVHGSQHQRIKEVMIDNVVDWRRKHTKALALTYAHTPEKQLLKNIINLYYTADWKRLVDLNMALIVFLHGTLQLPTRLILDEEIEGRKEQLITNICQKYNATTYLSGYGGKNYITGDYVEALRRAHITCQYVAKDLTSQYPYSLVHYLLTEGRDWVHHQLV